MADKRNKDIPAAPDVVAAIKRLGLAGYLRDEFEAYRGDWHEWECGENDEDLTGAWDGDTEQAAFFVAMMSAAEALEQRAELAEARLAALEANVTRDELGHLVIDYHEAETLTEAADALIANSDDDVDCYDDDEDREHCRCDVCGKPMIDDTEVGVGTCYPCQAEIAGLAPAPAPVLADALRKDGEQG